MGVLYYLFTLQFAQIKVFIIVPNILNWSFNPPFVPLFVFMFVHSAEIKVFGQYNLLMKLMLDLHESIITITFVKKLAN